MRDEEFPQSDPPTERFTRALGVELERRMEIPLPFDEVTALARLQARMGVQSIKGTGERAAKRITTKREIGSSRARLLRSWLGVASALAIAAMVIFHGRWTPKTLAPVSRVYETRAQELAIIDLGDGNHLTLAPQSALHVEYLGKNRRLVLQYGEANFEVTHAAATPFVVHSGGAMIQVLGTEFLVRHAREDSRVRVAVANGKVRVTRSGARDTDVILTPGQVGDVTDSITHVSAVDDDPAPGTEWQPGRIIFYRASVVTVLQTVSKWYGYHFRYADSTLATRKVTMQVSTQSSAEALAGLERVLQVNLTVLGDTITLVPQSSRSNHGPTRIRTYDLWTPTREVGR